MRPRRGFTAVELAVAVAVAALLAAGAAYTIQAVLARSDQVLADTTLDRVINAQVAHAAGHGTYAFGTGGDDADLEDLLPETLARDLVLTHGTSTGLDAVSVAVGSDQTLVAAVRLPSGACRWRTVPAVTGRVSDQISAQDATVTCRAELLLPADETPAWR